MRNISFGKRPTSITFGYEFDDVPEHQFFDLFNIPLFLVENIALFPGSFDPFTKGHLDIVNRSLRLFHKVIIAIGHNSKKHRYFDISKTKDTSWKIFSRQFSSRSVDL